MKIVETGRAYPLLPCPHAAQAWKARSHFIARSWTPNGAFTSLCTMRAAQIHMYNTG